MSNINRKFTNMLKNMTNNNQIQKIKKEIIYINRMTKK